MNDSVKPEGEAHVEPPGQARNYQPPHPGDVAVKSLKANGVDVWSADKDLPSGTRQGPNGDIKPSNWQVFNWK